MKNFIYITFSIFPLLSFGQINDSIPMYDKTKGQEMFFQSSRIETEINEALYYPIFNLKETNEIKLLKTKLESEINTVASCALFYKFSNALKLSFAEKNALKERMKNIADGYAAQKRFMMFKLSGGYSSVTGFDEEIISGKKVTVILLGGDCMIDEVEKLEEEILDIFNTRIKRNL